MENSWKYGNEANRRNLASSIRQRKENTVTMTWALGVFVMQMEYAKEAICINVLTNFSKKQIEIYLSLVDERNNASDWTSFGLKSGSTFEPFKKNESGQNLLFI